MAQHLTRIQITVSTHVHDGRPVPQGERIDVPAPVARWLLEQAVGVPVPAAPAGAAKSTATG